MFSLYMYIKYIFFKTLGLLTDPRFNSGRLCQDAASIQWWLTIKSDIQVRTMNLIDNLKDEMINPSLIYILFSTSCTQGSTKTRQLQHWSFDALGTAWKLHKCNLVKFSSQEFLREPIFWPDTSMKENLYCWIFNENAKNEISGIRLQIRKITFATKNEIQNKCRRLTRWTVNIICFHTVKVVVCCFFAFWFIDTIWYFFTENSCCRHQHKVKQMY